MTTPSGLLMYGQAGNYNAIEDRMMVAALAGGRKGMVAAPTLAALTGLVVAIGPWAAIVDCGDRTVAVIGSRAQQNITVAAGGTSARTDLIWANIDPDAGTWQAGIITQAQAAGRAGALLGTITVPAGANTSAAMDLKPAQPRLAGTGRAVFPVITLTQATWQTLASTIIPGGDAEAGAVYELEMWGNGVQGTTTRQRLDWRILLGTVPMTTLSFGSVALASTGAFFRLVVKSRAICHTALGTGTLFTGYLEATISEFGANLAPANGNTASGFESEASGTYAIDTTRDQTLALQGQWGATGGSPTFTSRVARPARTP